MSGTKKCPYCGEEIKAEAKKCRYCGEWLNDNMGAEAQASAQESAARQVQEQVNESTDTTEGTAGVDPKLIEHLIKTKHKFYSSLFVDLFVYVVLICEFLSSMKYLAKALNVSFYDGNTCHGLGYIHYILNGFALCRLIPDWITNLSVLLLGALAFAFYQRQKYAYKIKDPALHKKTVFWAMLLTVGLCSCGLSYVCAGMFDEDLFAVVACIFVILTFVALPILGKKYKQEYDDPILLLFGTFYVGVMCLSFIVQGISIACWGEGSVGFNVSMCIMSLLALVALYLLVEFLSGTSVKVVGLLKALLGLLIFISIVLFLLPKSCTQKLEMKAAEIEIENELESMSDEAEKDKSAEVYQLKGVEDASLMHGGPELVEMGSYGDYNYYLMSEYSDGCGENGCPAGLFLYRLKGGDPSSAAGIDLSDINNQSGADETGYKFYADCIMDYAGYGENLYLILQDSRDMEKKEPSMALVKLNLDTYKATILFKKERIDFNEDKTTVIYADSYDENAKTEEIELIDL